MIILDTNVISALMHQVPDAKIVAWLDSQPRTSIWTTSVTVLEIRFGLQVMATGKRQIALIRSFESLLAKIGGRVAPFDSAAAGHAANLMAARQKKGRPGDLRDTMIAGIVLSNRASLATRNTSHFADLSETLLNPWVP